MKIEFWGTRGSIPSPGPDTIKYGGNTPCVAVTLEDGALLILDAGTGIRKLGLELEKNNQTIKGNIFITHSHWDHIQGVPFFTPAYREGNEFNILGCASVNQQIQKSLSDLMLSPYFPVSFETLKATMNFIDRDHDALEVHNAKVELITINHPGDGLGFRITENGKVFVFLTDNELNSPQFNKTSYGDQVEFCRGADLLVHDAMYTREEWQEKRGWGHSYYVDALHLAIDAGVKQLALFHHEPEHNDEAIDNIVADCQRILRKKGLSLTCFGARENQIIEL